MPYLHILIYRKFETYRLLINIFKWVNTAKQSTGRSDTQGLIFILSVRDPEPFDWYQRFMGIKDLVQGCFTPESKLLNVGAGNSRKHHFYSLGLSEEMFDEGY